MYAKSIHICHSENNLAKIWLEPQVEIAKKGELTDRQLAQVVGIAERFRKEMLGQWAKFKAGERVKSIKVKEQ